jgi:hypothetical protein
MILYVNGDSHSAACEAAHPAGFLCDDSRYYTKGMIDPVWKDEVEWAPYPDNLKISYGQLLADQLGAKLHCHARSAGSNDRILRTTQEYLKDFTPDFVLIGWSTWEREEWYNQDDNTWYQVNCSGTDSVPEKWRQRYKEYVIQIDWNKKIKEAHEKIWDFHQYLKNKNIPHLFFNCNLTLYHIIEDNNNLAKDWGYNYIKPYSSTFSYGEYLVDQGCRHNDWHHFGPDGHKKWAEFLLPHLTQLL